ncbi:MAG: hypothetical protein IJC74_07710 [Clostridia bacterium]|nr:hypothetical protein [Clostridia bacterium]
MMTCFFKIDSAWQIFLLILNQLTVFSYVISIMFLFRRGCSPAKLIGVISAFILTVILYITLQLDSRITGGNSGIHLHIPYIILLVIVVLSMIYSLWALLSETRVRKTISKNSIKDAFDNLPTGVCFFNAAGLPVLCNRMMQRISFSVCGKDLQFITEIEEWFYDDFTPMSGVKKLNRTFILPDGKAWHIIKRSFDNESGNAYTQFIAADVTELYKKREEVMQETEHLRNVQEELQRLSANVVAVTREEEILNTKMRVHDEMGRCLIAAQKYLKDENKKDIPDSIATSWQRAVSMIKYNNDTPDEDMLLQIRKTCEFVKLGFVMTGKLPDIANVAYILTCAVRECVTNAVRYAEATELYADFSENENCWGVTLTNNGKLPDGEITEGGGLSSLRKRVERAGGQMRVESFPVFKLTVTLPKEKEAII